MKIKYAPTNTSLHSITDSLREEVSRLRFAPPVTHVYNPLDYARENYARYIEKFGHGNREIIFVGMNPGPWGMTQTGVPFGEISCVRDWLGISGPVRPPKSVHAKVPIMGFDCHRSEVSGRRVWGWVKENFGTPERFFERFYIANYCPLIFLEDSGRNRTPDKLPVREREALLAACDRALRKTVELMAPTLVIGIGGFAETRAKIALEGLDVRIGRILHPSPASPLANRDWGKQASEQLKKLGVQLPIQLPTSSRRAPR